MRSANDHRLKIEQYKFDTERDDTIHLSVSATNDDSRADATPEQRPDEKAQKNSEKTRSVVELKTFNARSKMQREMDGLRRDAQAGSQALSTQKELFEKRQIRGSDGVQRKPATESISHSAADAYTQRVYVSGA